MWWIWVYVHAWYLSNSTVGRWGVVSIYWWSKLLHYALHVQFQSYEALRREHDAQIMRIAMESGLRIGPEQYSNLLYGKSTYKSQMQSILDKVCIASHLWYVRTTYSAWRKKVTVYRHMYARRSSRLYSHIRLCVHLYITRCTYIYARTENYNSALKCRSQECLQLY